MHKIQKKYCHNDKYLTMYGYKGELIFIMFYNIIIEFIYLRIFILIREILFYVKLI